ncbi:glycosyltransferase family 2 protein [Brevibacillus sp. B_LB10_24]|uniref:glycosyltransferase family 2 protein n=1 Tax=Brevibacillus sp. B_LB10_24 TaxID=3380645 RepID=UPI0038B75449
MKVAVCITTCKRHEGLKRLLKCLENLTFKRCIPDELQVVVVDNDPAEPEKAFCESESRRYRWTLRYVAESQRGISYARNRAIVTTRDDFDFIAFIDDDEVPEHDWLDELLHVQQSYDADIVAGPVLSIFEEEVPEWVLKGKFFERARYETGYRMKMAATGNVLIRAEVVRNMETIFDERLALTGGEDTHFFMRLHKMGHTIVWADNALAHEYVPNSRVTMNWIWKRAYRLGNTITFCEIDLYPSVRVRVKRLLLGGGKVVQGVLQMIISPVLGQHAFVWAIRHMYRGFGMLAALAGRHYEEYRKVQYTTESKGESV